jgi:hypothetical protein
MAPLPRLRLAVAAVIALSVVAGAAVAQAQDARQPPTLPERPNPQTTVPEKVDPPLAGTRSAEDPPTGSLSRQLEGSKGVIRPPGGIDPEIRVPAPVPDPGTTRVIPPPGSPGSTSPVEPR